MPDTKPAIDAQTIKAIESVLAKGLKAEVIPAKHGIIVKQIKQETVLEPQKK